MQLLKNMYARKRIYNGCMVQIENSVTRNSCSACYHLGCLTVTLMTEFSIHTSQTLEILIISHMNEVMRKLLTTNELRHDKTNKVSVRQAKTQISLGVRPVWSVSSLSAWRNLGPLVTHWAHSEDSDQTGLMPRLIWVFAGRTLILLVLSCRGSNMQISLHLYRSLPKKYYTCCIQS